MGNFVGRADLMRGVDASASSLGDMAARNDLQGAAMKLRDDIRTMDHDSFMVELGEFRKATENSATQLEMRQIFDPVGNPIGKDINLVSHGVDVDQRPIDCSIPIGQLYGDRGLAYREPISVRADCAFELTCKPGDGWYHRDDGELIFGGRFPDGQIHLDIGKIDLKLGLGSGIEAGIGIGIGGGQEHRFYEGGSRDSNVTVINKEEIVNRTTNITNVTNGTNAQKTVNVENRTNNVQNTTKNTTKNTAMNVENHVTNKIKAADTVRPPQSQPAPRNNAQDHSNSDKGDQSDRHKKHDK